MKKTKRRDIPQIEDGLFRLSELPPLPLRAAAVLEIDIEDVETQPLIGREGRRWIDRVEGSECPVDVL